MDNHVEIVEQIVKILLEMIVMIQILVFTYDVMKKHGTVIMMMMNINLKQ